MQPEHSDTIFSDAMSRMYERHLVPLIFEPYAAETAERLAARPLKRVLEIAAGTGVLTRALAARLPDSVSITATDLNQAMLDQAASVGTSRPVEWRQANALDLPFDGGEFDAVVCEFGAMFFPDKPKAFAEARRVLREGGVFLFSVWDRIEDNEFADVITNALSSEFPSDPPLFLRRTPHGYFDREQVSRDLSRGNFVNAPSFTTIAERSRAHSAMVPSIAYCQGTPLRAEIETRGPGRLEEFTERAAHALEERFGHGAVDGKIQAHLVMVER